MMFNLFFSSILIPWCFVSFVSSGGIAEYKPCRCSFKSWNCQAPVDPWIFEATTISMNFSQPWFRIDLEARYYVFNLYIKARGLSNYLDKGNNDYDVFLRNVGFWDDYKVATGCWDGETITCYGNGTSYRYVQLTGKAISLEVHKVEVYGKLDEFIDEKVKSSQYYNPEAISWSIIPHENDDGQGLTPPRRHRPITKNRRKTAMFPFNQEAQTLNFKPEWDSRLGPDDGIGGFFEDEEEEEDDLVVVIDDDDDGGPTLRPWWMEYRFDKDEDDGGRQGIGMGGRILLRGPSGYGAWVMTITALTYLHLI